MRYHVTHQTAYQYQSDVAVSHHVARLTPRPRPGQLSLETKLQIDPAPGVISAHDDYFGNTATFLAVERAHRQLTVTAESWVEIEAPLWPAPTQTVAWETIRRLCQDDADAQAIDPSQFTFPSPHIPIGADFLAYARDSFLPERPILEAVLDLNARIYSDFQFDPAATTVATPLEQVLRQRRGVCQDFAHLQIACLRSLGLAARYISGYLETKPPPGKPKLTGSDASHAWTQVWCGDPGWIDVDPTNNLLPSDRHITLAWGRDYSDVCPIRGVIVGGGKHQLAVAVDVVSDLGV